MTTEINAAGIIPESKRVMSPAAKAALDASRARYDLAQALLTVMEQAVVTEEITEDYLDHWLARAAGHQESERNRKAEEAAYRKLHNQRGVGLALHREKTNAALNLMEMLKAAGLSEADILSGKVTPAEIAKVLSGGAAPMNTLEELDPEYDEEGNAIEEDSSVQSEN